LAVEFGKKFKTIGFDLSQTKIDACKRSIDPTGEVATKDLQSAVRQDGLEPTTDPCRIASADFQGFGLNVSRMIRWPMRRRPSTSTVSLDCVERSTPSG